MEEPIFYQARPAGQKISPRQKQALLKQIVRLKRESFVLRKRAVKFTHRCHRLGIAAPDFSAQPLQQWGQLLRGLQHILTK